MKFALPVLCCLFLCITTNAQITNPVNLRLYNKALANESEVVDVLVKGNVDSLSAFLETHNGLLTGKAGNIAALRLSLHDLSILLQRSYVDYAEANLSHNRVMNDTMRMLTHVNEVFAGQTPLPQGYNGNGVLLGIIDSGIDTDHPDFKDSLGQTRVQWLWDMTKPLAANTPVPYGYGQEWSKQDIDNGLSVAHTGEDQFGHGSYVTGIAAGDGSGISQFRGVAPMAGLIIVSYDFASIDTVPRLLHAVQYIFDRAQQLGKPCVINASLGDYYGSHDGLDLESQYISNLINQQSGRFIVAAAGNIGIDYPFHVGKVCSAADTSFTWFNYDSNSGYAYVQIFADSAQFANVYFSIGADKTAPYSFRGTLPYITVANTLNNPLTRQLTVNGNRIGIVQTLATKNNGVYSMEVLVVPDSTTYKWRFSTTGNGYYDSWSFQWEWQSIPSAASFPDIVHYQPPDTMQSIVSGIACLDNVLTVGNYFNTDRHIDYNNTLQISVNDKPRQLASNSSRGPTRDGRIKPDVAAPGHHIISCGVLSTMASMIAAQPYKVAPGGMHVTGGGTSASAPVVAGIAALFLQQNPNAGWQDIKNAITSCAVTDQYTWGPYPNNAWGYGKADAFATLTTCGFVNTSEIEKGNFRIYPNPAADRIYIDNVDNDFTIRITDIQGRVLITVDAHGNSFPVSTSDLKTGLYFIHILKNGKRLTTGSFEIAR
jgi:subtilisin family serine protease